MSDDIVKRLRAEAADWRVSCCVTDAAEEIERLRAENGRLLAELAKYACGCRVADDCPNDLSESFCRRVALAEQEKK